LQFQLNQLHQYFAQLTKNYRNAYFKTKQVKKTIYRQFGHEITLVHLITCK